MRTPICERLGIEAPIFAFSHCRDVVVEVTKAGGFGVLGAVTHSPEQLERELKWIDEHVGGRPYGVDVLIPVVYDREAEASTEEVIDLIPAEQRQFVDKLLDAEGVPPLSADDAAEARRELIGRGSLEQLLHALAAVDGGNDLITGQVARHKFSGETSSTSTTRSGGGHGSRG